MSDRGYDIRWTFGGGVAFIMASALLPSAAYPLIVVAGALVVFSGLALALDYHNAIDRWLEVIQAMPRSRLSPRTFAKVTGFWIALLGFVGLLGGAAMLILGETPPS